MHVPSTVTLEHVPCPVGCERGDETVLTGRDLLHDLPGEFSVVRCSTCGLMRTSPRPTPDSIGLYYPVDYGPYRGTRVIEAPKSQPLWKRVLHTLITTVFRFNTDPLPRQSPGRLLEIGCASGAFLHRMAGEGWQVEGIEFSPMAAETARSLGYSVHAGSLESAPDPREPFDLVVGWMVLEHLHDPVRGLQKLKAWAKPGAWLVLSVPNAGSLEFSLFGPEWYALQLPTHLHHFTPASLERTLRAGGWKTERVLHQRTIGNLVASAGYKLRKWGFDSLGRKMIAFPERAGRWHYALYPIAFLLGIFGQTGRMTVWARAES